MFTQVLDVSCRSLRFNCLYFLESCSFFVTAMKGFQIAILVLCVCSVFNSMYIWVISTVIASFDHQTHFEWDLEVVSGQDYVNTPVGTTLAHAQTSPSGGKTTYVWVKDLTRPTMMLGCNVTLWPCATSNNSVAQHVLGQVTYVG